MTTGNTQPRDIPVHRWHALSLSMFKKLFEHWLKDRHSDFSKITMRAKVLSFAPLSVKAATVGSSALVSFNEAERELRSSMPFDALYVALGCGLPRSSSEERNLGALLDFDAVSHQLTFLAIVLRADNRIEAIEEYEDIPSPLITCVYHLLKSTDRLPSDTSQTLKTRLAWSKNAKGKRTPPPPFYQITLDPVRVAKVARQRPPRHVEWSYRWDVRGHERLMVKRGTLPLADGPRARLLTRGWILSTIDPDWVDRLLASRSLPAVGDDEWVACRLVDVKAHVKGPKDKEYVPALRIETPLTAGNPP